jgi:hypothetical protein
MKIEPANQQSTVLNHWTEPVRWLHFLSRWSVLLALTASFLALVFMVGLGQQASDNILGPDFVELLQAVRSPFWFRFVWTIDAFVWLMLGVSLLAFAGFLRSHAALRPPFIAICGLAQLFGAFGSFLRLDGISALASRYAVTSTMDHPLILEAYLHLGRVINSSNHLGVLLQGMGYLFIASIVFSLPRFPRWLAAWLLLPGLLAITQFSLFITGAQYVFFLNAVGLIGGNIALNLAIAFVLWQPTNPLIHAVEGDNTGI